MLDILLGQQPDGNDAIVRHCCLTRRMRRKAPRTVMKAV